MRRILKIAVCATILLGVVVGCAGPTRLPAVPVELTTEAVVPGMPNVRYWVDDDPQPIVRDAIAAVRREWAQHERSGRLDELPPARFLAISGGGDDGAFGAGLLVGWTEAGTRPEFKAVTGISTGALIAPFAFLGPDYDDELKAIYTTISPDDIFESRSIFAALFNDALSDTTPLWRLIERYVNEALLQAIAAEHEKGRLLLIGTTNLDARRPVVWNVGAIAASNHPGALQLIRSILVASAAVPGVFPPVMIDVEAQGTVYQEMHVDGGAMAQVFLYPPSLNVRAVTDPSFVTRKRELYIIRNARLDPNWATTERRTLDIAGRAISSLIQSQGTGDLFQIYLVAQRDGVDYNLAHIGSDFNAAHLEDFDTAYMRQLFDYAYAISRDGYPWQKSPPGYSVSREQN